MLLVARARLGLGRRFRPYHLSVTRSSLEPSPTAPLAATKRSLDERGFRPGWTHARFPLLSQVLRGEGDFRFAARPTRWGALASIRRGRGRLGFRSRSGIIGATVARGSAGEMGSRENSNMRSATGVWCIRTKSAASAGARRIPGPAQMIAYERREPLIYSGIVIYITTSASLAIALLMS